MPGQPQDPSRHPVRARPPVLAAVAAGGVLGAAARYGTAELVGGSPGSWPWATLAANLSGSFALGAVAGLLLGRFGPTRLLRPFLATGFLGAFTTYSTLAVETDLLVRDGRVALAAAYLAASVGLGLTAAWAGLAAARLVTALPARRHAVTGPGGRSR